MTSRRLPATFARLAVAVAALAVGALPAATLPAAAAAPAPASVSIVVAPAIVAPPALPRGGTGTETLILSNEDGDDRVVAFELGGDAAGWLAIEDRRGSPVGEVTIPSGGVALVDVRVSVPGDVANGTYDAEIRLTPRPAGAAAGTTAPAQTADDPSALHLGAVVPVRIQVGGEMVLQGRMVEVRAPLAEVGQPQRIVVAFANGGTVGFGPRVTATISRSGLPVAVLRTAGDSLVDPGRSRDVELQWDTSDAVPGAYDLRVEASAEGLAFPPLATSFRLEPAGSVSRDGEIESLEVVGRPEQGGTVRLRAVFRNKSDVPVSAVLVADVEHDGRLTGEQQTLPVMVPAGRQADLDTVLEQVEVGSYEVSGIVNYDGRETEQASVRFDVQAPIVVTPGGANRSGLLVGGAAVLLAAAVGVALVRRRRHGDDEDDLF